MYLYKIIFLNASKKSKKTMHCLKEKLLYQYTVYNFWILQNAWYLYKTFPKNYFF